MAGIDKVTRILILYSRLIEGRKIEKKTFCEDMKINRRTFDRDIEDIRVFFSEMYTGEEVIYDRSEDSYYLKNMHQKEENSGEEFTGIFERMGLKEANITRKEKKKNGKY